MSPLVSVILPVYNSEDFIKRAINCLISQTLVDFEILLIDDGSIDNTGFICDEYAEIDYRIRVFHKKNEGVASARQLGIENARGLYSIHFDADDIAEAGMLLEMYNVAIINSADVVIADFYEKKADGTISYVKQDFDSTLSSDILIDILERRLFGALWHKLIRTSLYSKKHIAFDTKVNYCEDVLVEAKMLKDDDVKVVHLPRAYYTYCHDNPNSITINYNMEKLKMRQSFLKELHSVLNSRKFKHAFEATVWDVKMEAYCHGVLEIDDFHMVYPNSIPFLYHTNFSRRQRLKMILNTIFH